MSGRFKGHCQVLGCTRSVPYNDWQTCEQCHSDGREPSRVYTDAFAEWYDPHGVAVFIEDGSDEPPMLRPPRSFSALDFDALSVEDRLYFASFVACWKDFAGHEARDEVCLFKSKAAAVRAAKAIKRELKAMAKGEPGPTQSAVGFAASLGVAMRRKR